MYWLGVEPVEKFVQVDEFVCDHLFGIGYHFEKFRSEDATKKKKSPQIPTYVPTHSPAYIQLDKLIQLQTLVP